MLPHVERRERGRRGCGREGAVPDVRGQRKTHEGLVVVELGERSEYSLSGATGAGLDGAHNDLLRLLLGAGRHDGRVRSGGGTMGMCAGVQWEWSLSRGESGKWCILLWASTTHL